MAQANIPFITTEEDGWQSNDLYAIEAASHEYNLHWIIKKFSEMLYDKNYIAESCKFKIKNDFIGQLKLNCVTNVKAELALNFFTFPNYYVSTNISVVDENFHAIVTKKHKHYCKQKFKQIKVPPLGSRRSFLTDKKWSVHNNLVIFCKIKIVDASKSCRADCFNNSDLILNMHSLLKDSIFSDFLVTVQNKKFPCHRAILAARCKFFEALLTHDMVEKQLNKLDLKDIDPNTFENLLLYIYTGEVKLNTSNAVPLLVAADRFCLDRLCALCEQYLSLSLSLESALHMKELAMTYHLPHLELKVKQFIQDFKLDPESTGIEDQFSEIQKKMIQYGENDQLNVYTPFYYDNNLDRKSKYTVDQWCSTQYATFAENNCVVKGFKISCINMIPIDFSSDFFSHPGENVFQRMWKMKAKTREGPSSKNKLTFYLSCTHIFSNIVIEKMKRIYYRFSFINESSEETFIFNGSKIFSSNDCLEVTSITVQDILDLDMLQKDDLVISCVLSTQKSYIIDSFPSAAIPKCELTVNLKSLLDSGLFADLSIKTKCFDFLCHKAILVARSPYFKAKIKSCSKDEIIIDDVQPVFIKELISYIYSGDWRLRGKFLPRI